ncbi:MAG: dinucleotide-utilizing protein [Flavobacteriaceae bacterium]|nr:MAG: dinucleotide-utilizing protein [Flavobacteriaceae bacterium]
MTTLTAEESKQYSRHLLLNEIGEVGQLKLKKAKVLVIGAGGLGCPVLQYLAAAGVGAIGIVDDDSVEQSNLQRQILFNHEDIGKNKARIAAEKLSVLNPFIKFDVYPERLNKDNALTLFANYDIIVDGTDNFQSRYLINDAAILTNKPVVFGSIFKFAGQVSVFNYKNGPSYRCLYPNPPKEGSVPNCSDIGVLGVLPGIIGALQANEVLKMICGIGKVLSGTLLTYDALGVQQQLFSFQKNSGIVVQTLDQDYAFVCAIKTEFLEIDFKTYQNTKDDFNVLDVRTFEEREQDHIGGLHIPLGELEDRQVEISTDKKLLVYCKSGMRSKAAIKILEDFDFKNDLINLKGGLNSS